MFTRAMLLAMLALSFAAQTGAEEAAASYPVSVWARVLFGPDGRPATYTIVDEHEYPEKFLENVKVRVASTRVPPPDVDGRAVSLRSGVEIRFTVTPTADGGTVQMTGLALGPLPTTRYFASYPKDIAQSRGWRGVVLGVCTVGTDGRCKSIDVEALPGIPESVRRFARASLERWEFEPQALDGLPIEGEYTLRVRLNTLDDKPDDFRNDKFLQLLRRR